MGWGGVGWGHRYTSTVLYRAMARIPMNVLANQDTDADEGLGRGQWGEGILSGKKNGVMGGGKGSWEMLGRRQKIDCETITDIMCLACLAS
jgi:hypothetical protein